MDRIGVARQLRATQASLAAATATARLAEDTVQGGRDPPSCTDIGGGSPGLEPPTAGHLGSDALHHARGSPPAGEQGLTPRVVPPEGDRPRVPRPRPLGGDEGPAASRPARRHGGGGRPRTASASSIDGARGWVRSTAPTGRPGEDGGASGPGPRQASAEANEQGRASPSLLTTCSARRSRRPYGVPADQSVRKTAPAPRWPPPARQAPAGRPQPSSA